MEDKLDEMRQDIAVLKDSVEESKMAVSKLEGRREELVDNMQERFGVTDLVAAEKKLADIGKKRVKLQKDVTVLYGRIQKAMEVVESNE